MFSRIEPAGLFMALCLSICLCLWFGSVVDAYQDGDWQLWNANSLEGNIGQCVKIGFEEQFRVGDDVSELFYHFTSIGFAWNTTDWLQAAVTYSQIYELKNGVWKEENRPFVDGIILKNILGVQISDRSRLERRIREGAENIWRYRNNLKLTSDKKWKPFRIQPYMSGEIFIDLEEEGFNQYRLMGGFKGKLTDFLQTDLHYLRQAREKNDEWVICHVFGAKLKVSL